MSLHNTLSIGDVPLVFLSEYHMPNIITELIGLKGSVNIDIVIEACRRVCVYSVHAYKVSHLISCTMDYLELIWDPGLRITAHNMKLHALKCCGITLLWKSDVELATWINRTNDLAQYVKPKLTLSCMYVVCEESKFIGSHHDYFTCTRATIIGNIFELLQIIIIVIIIIMLVWWKLCKRWCYHSVVVLYRYMIAHI